MGGVYVVDGLVELSHDGMLVFDGKYAIDVVTVFIPDETQVDDVDGVVNVSVEFLVNGSVILIDDDEGFDEDVCQE